MINDNRRVMGGIFRIAKLTTFRKLTNIIQLKRINSVEIIQKRNSEVENNE